MLSLIWAEAENGVIGRDNQLPWHLPEDMRHFKSLTMGKPCIMGRHTWESLPEKFRPLPGRANIVISRNAAFDAPGATVVTSVEAALELDGAEKMVIGGAMLYARALPFADRIYLTRIHAAFDGDAHAPVIGAEWREVAREDGISEKSGLSYSFLILEKK